MYNKKQVIWYHKPFKAQEFTIVLVLLMYKKYLPQPQVNSQGAITLTWLSHNEFPPPLTYPNFCHFKLSSTFEPKGHNFYWLKQVWNSHHFHYSSKHKNHFKNLCSSDHCISKHYLHEIIKSNHIITKWGGGGPHYCSVLAYITEVTCDTKPLL
jgi:hypothetical protein